MAVLLLYFVHYIHGSAVLMFRTLFSWLYEVYTEVEIIDCNSDERFHTVKRVQWCYKTKGSLELIILIRLRNSNKAEKLQMFTNAMCKETNIPLH